MNPERHQQAKRLFLAACELDQHAAAAFLNQACADDPELREEVASLLKHHHSGTIIDRSIGDTDTGKIVQSPPNAHPATDQTRDFPGLAAVKKEERFPPGSMIAGRYRILGLLGRGGMGEVYRADDLKLDQPVALKFLPRLRSDDDTWLARFRNEVRLARKVTHPNVNRVYDIGEAEGEVFFSMEYVDGENLASLLRRIGRITGAKATEIAGQICAGLGAAHDRGVLHRDLKPANVMIDGEGKVRITDFGIAALVADVEEKGVLAGTPAYLAPELFDGEEPSVRSDLYSLGIVLYELVTGKQPFESVSPGRRERTATPVPPSAVGAAVDPTMERVILQCLDPDPGNRPESAYAVAEALPGFDPLAAVLAAGRTPSPSMVAAAGTHAGLHPKLAVTYLGMALIGLITIVLLANQTLFLPNAGLGKPPAVLADKAEEILRLLGYKTDGMGQMQGFAIDRGYLEHMRSQQEETLERGRLASGRPPAVFFWYRRGDIQLPAPAPIGEPALLRRLPAEPGTKTVRLDGQGRLLGLSAVPIQSRLEQLSRAAPDWPQIFALAGLDFDRFQAINPVRNPPMYADHIIAWKGDCPEHPAVPLRVEGASLGGRPVYFNLILPWEQTPATATKSTGLSLTPSRTFVVRFVFYLVALLGGIVLAWRNTRLGHGDRHGANRLALCVLVLALLDWIVGERHSAVFIEEAVSSYLWVARATLAAAAAWICYMALEVYVRRLWPQTLITWTRLLKGQFRDPLLGRDLLIGGIFGIGMVLVLQADSLLPSWLGVSAGVLKLPGVGYHVGELLGLRYKLGTVIGVLLSSIALGLVFLLLMLLLRVVVRIGWLAAVLFCVVLTAALAVVSADDTFLPLITNAVLALGIVFVLTRVGLVAVIVGQFVSSLILANPITSDFGAWYAPASTFTVVLVAALILYGFHTALAGRPILGRRLPGGY